MMHRIWLLAICTLFTQASLAQDTAPQFLDAPEQLTPDSWRLTWSSEVGRLYRVDRSFDLETWTEVDTIFASEGVSFLDDNGLDGETLAFWRVVALPNDPGDGLFVGDLDVNYLLEGANSTVTYSLAAFGAETVDRVQFFDNGVPIGDGDPGLGGTWSLTLDWDPANPEIQRIEAVVSTEQGTVEPSGQLGVLLADPEYFVPLDPTGRLRTGELVEVAADGSLGEFRFFPEGSGDLLTSTGVFFEFPSGAQLTEANGSHSLSFSTGKFFRGPGDPNPVEVVAGLRSLDINDISPDVVRSAFSLPEGPIELNWGSGSVAWDSGALGDGGWNDLQVELPIGDFGLPGTRLNASVGLDPDTRLPFLSVCYYGEWSPSPGGPVFRIPQADPLKIYYSQENGVSAHGTAEAEFPTGAKVRGTLSWIYPNFEFRFEGREITIPALDSLKGLLPAEPLASAPAGNSPAELDAFTNYLEGYQASMRGLAAGATGQADVADAGTAVAPPSPSDPAGAALAAWTGRVLSWQGDRSGTVLSEAQMRDLNEVVKQATRTGEGAHDLLTVLLLLREVLTLKDALEEVRGGGATSDQLAATVNAAGTRLLATAERIVAAKPIVDITPDVKKSALLLREIDLLIEQLDAVPVIPGGPLPGVTISAYRRSYGRVATTYSNGMDRGIWLRLNIDAGDFSGSDNPILQTMNEEELLAVLDDVLGALNTLRSIGSANRGLRVSQATGGPDDPPLHEAWRQVQDVFEVIHFDTSLAALQGNDFAGVRRALAMRARYFELHEALGETLFSDDDNLRPLTGNLLDTYRTVQARLPGSVQALTCSSDAAVFSKILESTLDQGANGDLRFKVRQAEACLDLLANRNGAQVDCDAVYLRLAEAGLQVNNPLPSEDTARTVRMTGRYEDTYTSGTPVTMQLNQAGRLLLGWHFTHQIRPGLSNRSTRTKRLIGMLKSETPTTAEFYVLFREDDGSFLGRRTLDKKLFVATKTPQGVNLEERPLPGRSAQTIRYVKTTNVAAFSPILANLFENEARAIFLAQQRAPLHSRQIRQVRGHYATILAGIENYLAADSTGRDAQAQNIGRLLRNLSFEVSTTQVPLARQIMREMLSRSSAESDGDRLTHWNWLRVIFSRHNNQSPVFDEFRDFMGPEITAAASFDAFRYEITIEEGGLAVGPVGIKDVAIKIVKSRSDGAGQPAEINLMGSIGQGGAGLSFGDLPSGGAGGDEVVIHSDIEYSEQVLAGPVMLYGATAAAGIGITDISVGPAILVLYGDFTLPPFVIPLPFVDNDNTLQLPSLEMNFGLGAVRGVSGVPASALALTAEPEDQSFTADAGIVGAVHFDVGSAALRPCGGSELRNLVAELRAIFESDSASVSILGFTDAEGIPGNTAEQNDAFNQGLSDDRAETVKAALISLVGDGLAIPPDRIRAIGLGRRPSMGLTSPREDELNEVELAFLARKKATSPVLGEGDSSQEWRTVTILLNNLVSLDLGAEGTGAGQ